MGGGGGEEDEWGQTWLAIGQTNHRCQDIKRGSSQSVAGKAQMTPSHPTNSNRTDREENQFPLDQYRWKNPPGGGTFP